MEIFTILIILGLISFSIATPLFTYINQHNYSLPEAEQKIEKIGFSLKHTDNIVSPFKSVFRMDSKSNYATFYCWVQRVGLYPEINNNFEKSIDKYSGFVFINPSKKFENNEIKILSDYVKDGGKLIILDTINNSKSTSNQLLKSFDNNLYLFKEKINNNSVLNLSENKNINYTYMNNISIGKFDYGMGVIYVVFDSYLYSDEVMGNLFVVPNDYQRDIYETEYHILEEIVNN